MNSNVRYVGLDVHKRVVEACFLDAAGKELDRYRFDLDRETLRHFAKTRLTPHDHVALEATTNCWVVSRFLAPFVAKVVVSNPLITKAIAEAKVKTDKVDAMVLAQLLRCDFLPRVWQPDEATSLLRELTSRRTALVQDRTAVRNRVHSLLAVRLLTAPCDELFGKAGRAWLAGLSEDQLGAQGRLLLDTDLRLHDALEREIEHLDGELARHGYGDARVKLLMTRPGVNVTVAETLLAALGDVSRFRDGDHAASYLGLVPPRNRPPAAGIHGSQGDGATRQEPGKADCRSRQRRHARRRLGPLVGIAAREVANDAMPHGIARRAERGRRQTAGRSCCRLPSGDFFA